jgi:hypothetical protein
LEAAAIEPANACNAPGPMEVTTAAVSPYNHFSAGRRRGGFVAVGVVRVRPAAS